MLPLFIAEPCSAYNANLARKHGFRDESGSMAPALQNAVSLLSFMLQCLPQFL